MKKEDVIIIGGGPAGLLTACLLKRFGVSSLIIEKDSVGQSWRDMRDGMVMLSPASASHDMTSLTSEDLISSMVRVAGPFAVKEEFVEYLERFVKKNRLSIIEKSPVESVKKNGTFFEVKISGGGTYCSQMVVVATGIIGKPNIPKLRGLEGNSHIIHSLSYKGPGAYSGKKVLVVGAGNSGAELAVELSGVARVTLLARSKLKFFSRTRNLMHIRGLSESLLKELIKFEIVELKEGLHISHFEGEKVVFKDGTSAAFDEIILATGYLPHLPEFIKLPVAMHKGRHPELNASCESVSHEGLYFMGSLVYQKRPCSFIHCFRPLAEAMALNIAERLGH